jgi:hypothetical protein
LSSFIINGAIFFYQNANMTSFIQPKAGSSTNLLRGYNCNLSGNVDLSNITATQTIDLDDNQNLESVTPPIFTTSFTFYDFSGCALSVSGIDEIFASLNTFFSANTPTVNLTVNANGGTNQPPTGGQTNTDIVNLDTVVYPNAGFDFIFNINAA